MSWFPGSCKVDVVHSEEHLILPTKSGLKRAFPELCKDITPNCNLNPLLFNGHLQTAWTAKKYDGPPIHYKRRVFASNYNEFKGHFAVDFVIDRREMKLEDRARDEEGNLKDDQGLKTDPVGIGHTSLPPRTTYFTNAEFEALPSSDSKPTLIMLHGLSGGSYETYLRHCIEPLVEPLDRPKSGISGGEWEVLVCNSRGCAGSKITTPVLYNARATWDVRQIVKWCRKTFPNRPLFGIGFSLGANILANYLGEEGPHCPLKAACVVSNPWALDTTHKALLRTYIGHEVYSRAMGSSMKKLYETHKDMILQNENINRERVAKIKYLHEFDREIQGPTWGYPTETSYYRDASSTDSVLGIRVPTMALHALDDPIACDEAVPYEEIRATPYVVLVTTSGGGHLSWFEWSGQRWHAKPIVNYFRAMADVDHSKVEVENAVVKGPYGYHEGPFEFYAMRRKGYARATDD